MNLISTLDWADLKLCGDRNFSRSKSLIYLIPRMLDGEIAAAICMRDEDMERQRADEEFAKHGRYIG